MLIEYTLLLRLWVVTISNFIFEPSLPQHEKEWGVQNRCNSGLLIKTIYSLNCNTENNNGNL